MTARPSGLSITRLAPPQDWLAGLAADVAAGLTARPRRLPSKYLYDAAGSVLFQRITELPEYYLTRAETEILDRHAAAIVAAAAPEEMLELGPGYSHKTELLLAAAAELGTLRRYHPLDISEEPIVAGATRFQKRFPWLDVAGLVGDYFTDLPAVEHEGRLLVVILGSTIGNYPTDRRHRILADIAGLLGRDDAFLVGIDLVKDPATLVAAYDDAEGVTAAFSHNLLTVINRHLGADFDHEGFRHVATWDSEGSCIRIRLESQRPQTVHIADLAMDFEFAPGEPIHTEVACKFTRAGFGADLERAGMAEAGFWTDSAEQVGLVLARGGR